MTRKDNDYPKSIFCVPITLLRACGFIPLRSTDRNPKRHALDIFLRAVAACICLCSWFFLVTAADSSLAEFSRANKSLFPTNNPVIRAMLIATACVFSCRAAFVLTTVSIKRGAWMELFHRLNHAIKLYLEMYNTPKRKILRLKFATLGIVVTFIVLLCIWLYLHVMGAKTSLGKQHNLHDFQIVGSLGIKVYYWQLSLLWLSCGVLPFILTQLIFSVITVAALVQDTMLHKINSEIENNVERVRKISESEDAVTINGSIFKEIDENVSRARRLYNANLQFCHYFNKHFCTVLLFIYFADCFCMCGNVGLLVASFSHSEAQLGTTVMRWSTVYGVFMFMTGIVVCFVPMAYVYEQAKNIANNYENLVGLMEIVEQEHAECCRSEIVAQPSSIQPVFLREMFYGVGHLFHISGKFIVTTITFVISFVVLAFEIIDLSELKDRVAEVKTLLLNGTHECNR
ncbi:uncharacterized protein LOC129592708 [Paramacrobiotus metropolitanus]|uniref:uncharacterized protein LOC129592708 n=1 Tax=Paramacrobiotus metropolitanus TaxID=2943436 RepID=UPI00244628A8|nr:uncharacterized protein LOC129592708 [Paramacrobiotus metropolitanus]